MYGWQAQPNLGSWTPGNGAPPWAIGGGLGGLGGLAAQGQNGDSMVAHINPAEAMMLKAAGGSGTINPHTGLPQFDNPSLLPLMSPAPGANLFGNRFGAVPSWALQPYQIGMVPAPRSGLGAPTAGSVFPATFGTPAGGLDGLGGATASAPAPAPAPAPRPATAPVVAGGYNPAPNHPLAAPYANVIAALPQSIQDTLAQAAAFSARYGLGGVGGTMGGSSTAGFTR